MGQRNTEPYLILELVDDVVEQLLVIGRQVNLVLGWFVLGV